ncbi:cell division protein FtsA [Treponema sp. HNW]|uniref:cell division protein FtsA n=1 Tax=Treponema sp. HNW TaxID=3116654 RepID=UPI003D0B2D23
MSTVITAIDIGTSNVRALMGEYSDEGSLSIIGVGSAPSTGLRAGLIVNIEATMQSIKEAVEAAEVAAGCEALSCITAVGGSQIESFISKGLVAVGGKGAVREVNENDIERVLEASRAVNIPLDRHILHVVPRFYIVDGVSGIKNPLNRLGVRLESEVCIITSSGTSTQNMLRCVSRAGYTVEDVMLKTLAAAQAVVTEEEKEVGSILIDLGGGTTDVLVLADGSSLCTVSVPVGGSLVSNDIALVRGVSFETAEKLKISSGCCWEDSVSDDEEVVIPGIGGNPPQAISRREICSIIRPRIEEIFSMVRDRLPADVKRRHLNGSVILAGGGSLLPGIVELTAQEFKTENVRIARPGNYGGPVEIYRSPEFTTAAGLLIQGMAHMHKNDTGLSASSPAGKRSFIELTKKVGRWFKEMF